MESLATNGFFLFKCRLVVLTDSQLEVAFFIILVCAFNEKVHNIQNKEKHNVDTNRKERGT